MKHCIIFGGSGYIGRNLAMRLRATGRSQRTLLVDLHPPPSEFSLEGIEFVRHDIRESIKPEALGIKEPIDWIFNLAAVHREPGHVASEYFRTNLPSARHVSKFAHDIGCKNLLFTSSIAVYGPTSMATDEESSLEPVSPYGISKLCGELIFENWHALDTSRRLIVVRPGVIYGPGDPGNIGRLIKAVSRGRFAFPGRRDIRKSYGYIEGLLDSIEFTMDRNEKQITYNYVEKETLPLCDAVRHIAEMLDRPPPKFSVPIGVLASAARAIQIATGGNSPIHPDRVRKAATQTWIVPQVLINHGFKFRFDFRSSLEHWCTVEPGVFNRNT
jgi:GlcNAc-P-P-Und epimerase